MSGAGNKTARADEVDSTGKPPRRRPSTRLSRHEKTEAIDIGSILDAPLFVTAADGSQSSLPPLEIAARKLLHKAMKERCLRSAITFFMLCERHDLVPLPAATPTDGGIIYASFKTWEDREEFLEAFRNPPPDDEFRELLQRVGARFPGSENDR